MALTKKQLKALDIIVENPFIKNKDWAEQVGVNPATTSIWVNHDQEFRDEWNRRTEIIWVNAANKAKEKLIELMDSSNPNISLGATKAYLDKCLPNKTSVDVNSDNGIQIDVKIKED